MAQLIQTGGGSSGGGVTSVTGDGVVIGNSSSTGAVTLTLESIAANLVLAGPASGSSSTPTFRKMVTTDLPIDTPQGGAGFWSWYFSNPPLSLIAKTAMSSILTSAGAGGFAGWMMYVPRTMTITHLTYEISTVVAGGTFDVGLYKAAGGANSLVASTGGVSTNTGGANTPARVALTQGTVTIQAGWYYFAVTSSTVTTCVMLTYSNFAGTFNDGCSIFQGASGSGLNIVFTTGSSAGVLPTTMPTWSNYPTSGNVVTPPVVYFSN